MDPFSVAGLGLGVASLVLQLLGGCIRGYEIFLGMAGMPGKFQHLLVRMRLEQTRLLNWAEKVGLLEEVLEQSSVALQLHRNLIIDILSEIHRLFKDCLKIQAQFEGVGHLREARSSNVAGQAPIRPPQRSTLLAKALKALEKTAQVPTRLEWALVKQDKFEDLVGKLISYNDSMVSLLDRTTIQQLFEIQMQSQLAMLQLSSKVDELKQLALANQIQTRDSLPASLSIQAGSLAMMTQDQPDDVANFAGLASFKAQQMSLDLESSAGTVRLIDQELIKVTSTSTTRPLAIYQEQNVWIEWKEYNADHQLPSWPQMIGDRVRKLASLLGIENTPTEFRAPHCLGYFHDNDEDAARYGLLYRNPSEAQPLALLDLIQQGGKPSLTQRVQLAHTISRSIMYLHSVNWLHKGIRSENIVIFTLPGQKPDYSIPTVSGFEYARPDLPEELTEKPFENFEHDLYRHPDSLGHETRSKKSWDIYSLGVVLVEIVFWQPIGDLLNLHANQKGARSRLRRIRQTLLEDHFLNKVAVEAGERYKDVLQRCVTGGVELGIREGADEAEPEVGADMQRVFSQLVVGKLQSIQT